MLLLSSISNKDVLFMFSANKVAAEEIKSVKSVKSVQSALSDLKRRPERLQSQCNYRPFII